MEVPWDALPPETLERVIEHFVLREGSDYGASECSLEEKIAQVKALLQNGEALLVYSEDDNSVNIIPRQTNQAAAPSASAQQQPSEAAARALAKARQLVR